MYSGASRLLEANADDTGVVSLGRAFGSRHCLSGLQRQETITTVRLLEAQPRSWYFPVMTGGLQKYIRLANVSRRPAKLPVGTAGSL